MILGQADRYLAKTVVQAVVLVLLCATALMFLFSVAEEAGALGDRFTFGTVLWIVALGMPAKVHELVPFVIFLGAVIGLGSLSSRSELTVMRAAGISVLRLFGSCVMPVLGIFAMSWLVSDYIAPLTEAKATSFKRTNSDSGTALTDSKPFWTREGEIITGVDQVSVEETMHGIRQYQIGSDGGLVLARFAESARYEPKTRSWTLVGVRESRFFEERVETSYQERKDWQFNHDPESIRLRVFVDPNKLSTWDLWRQVRYMRQEGLAAAQYEVALWAALLQPLAILGLILIATGIVVGPLREVGMGQRLAVGVVIGLLFHNIQQFFAPMTTVYGLPAWVAVVLPITAAWFVGILLVRRAR